MGEGEWGRVWGRGNGVASKHLTFRARVTGFQSADPPLLLRRVDNENVALALDGVIKRDSFSVGRLFGRSVATARLGALPNTGPIRVRSRSQHWIFVSDIAD